MHLSCYLGKINPMLNLKKTIKSLIVKYILSYDSKDLVTVLRKKGVSKGDALMVHSSWRPSNGFQGKPVDMVDALKEVVGPDGLLSMTSMTYQNESTREFLSRGVAVKLRRSASKMGLLTEVFRRGKGIVRSLNPAHPILAWGDKANLFLEGHDNTECSFGKGSPFDKLLELKGKILCIDAPFSTITYTHFLEDRIASTLPFELYEPDSMPGRVIDSEGVEHEVSTRVLSQVANSLRREERLIHALDALGLIQRFKVGNTHFLLIECEPMTQCVDKMVAEGKSFFDYPSN